MVKITFFQTTIDRTCSIFSSKPILLNHFPFTGYTQIFIAGEHLNLVFQGGKNFNLKQCLQSKERLI